MRLHIKCYLTPQIGGLENVELEIDIRNIDQNHKIVESADHDDENNEQENDKRNIAKKNTLRNHTKSAQEGRVYTCNKPYKYRLSLAYFRKTMYTV